MTTQPRKEPAPVNPQLTALWQVLQQGAPDIAGYSSRVAWLSGRIGDVAGLDPPTVTHLQLAGQFHAVGKLALPVVLRQAGGPRTAADWTRLRQFPALGAQAVRDRGAPAVAAIIAQQDEHWDGSGGPGGLIGPQIRGAARVLTVAVAVVTTCSAAPGRVQPAYATALDLLAEGAGRQFDPTLVRLVLTLWPVTHPPALLLFACTSPAGDRRVAAR